MTGYHFTKCDCLRAGLHASADPFDALKYASGCWLHKVELDGDLREHGDPVDKAVGRCRTIIATIDGEPLLRSFARWCALQVVDLCDAPQVVRDYRDAAWIAAGRAAELADSNAAWSTADSAAGRAAESADRRAAERAAWSAVMIAQRKQFGAMVDAAFKKHESELATPNP